jgi:hypothetical protein
MRDAVIFGVAAAAFVASAGLVLAAGQYRGELGWGLFNVVFWLVWVAASAGTMYAVATGTFPW